MTIGPATWNNFVIYKGATFDETLPWIDGNGDPINLNGYTAEMKVRFGVEDTSPFLDLGSGITLGGAAGTIRLTLSAAQTALLPECVAVYDLRLTAGTGDSYYILEGIINILEMVTR